MTSPVTNGSALGMLVGIVGSLCGAYAGVALRGGHSASTNVSPSDEAESNAHLAEWQHLDSFPAASSMAKEDEMLEECVINCVEGNHAMTLITPRTPFGPRRDSCNSTLPSPKLSPNLGGGDSSSEQRLLCVPTSPSVDDFTINSRPTFAQLVRRVLRRSCISLPSVCSNPMWVRGMILYVGVTPLCFGVSMELAPAAVVLSLSAIHVVFNMIFAKTLLSEPVSQYDVFGTVAIASGTILVLFFSGTKQQSLQVVINKLQSLGGASYIAGCVAGAALFSCCSLLPMRRCLSRQRTTDSERPTTHLIKSFALATTSGIASGNTTLAGKVGLMILGSAPSILAPWTSAWTYLCLAVLLSLAAVDMLFLNLALKGGEAVYVVPVRSAMIFLPTVWGGRILFKEVPCRPLLFHIGFCFTLLGVVLLSLGKMKFWSSNDAAELSSTKAEAEAEEPDGLPLDASQQVCMEGFVEHSFAEASSSETLATT